MGQGVLLSAGDGYVFYGFGALVLVPVLYERAEGKGRRQSRLG